VVQPTAEYQRLSRRERLLKNDMDLRFWVNETDYNCLQERRRQAGISTAAYLRLVLKRHLKNEEPLA